MPSKLKNHRKPPNTFKIKFMLTNTQTRIFYFLFSGKKNSLFYIRFFSRLKSHTTSEFNEITCLISFLNENSPQCSNFFGTTSLTLIFGPVEFNTDWLFCYYYFYFLHAFLPNIFILFGFIQHTCLILGIHTLLIRVESILKMLLN